MQFYLLIEAFFSGYFTYNSTTYIVKQMHRGEHIVYSHNDLVTDDDESLHSGFGNPLGDLGTFKDDLASGKPFFICEHFRWIYVFYANKLFSMID